jgi:hypothetical protein
LGRIFLPKEYKVVDLDNFVTGSFQYSALLKKD